MKNELVNTIIDVVDNYSIGEATGSVARVIQSLFNGDKMLQYQKELKSQSITAELDYEKRKVDHEDNIAAMKSGNYRATLDYLLESQKNGYLTDVERLEILRALSDINNSLK